MALVPMKTATLSETSARQSSRTLAIGMTTAMALGAAGDVVDRGQRLALVGKRDLQHAGAFAEDRERLCLAEDIGERDAFAIHDRGGRWRQPCRPDPRHRCGGHRRSLPGAARRRAR